MQSLHGTDLRLHPVTDQNTGQITTDGLDMSIQYLQHTPIGVFHEDLEGTAITQYLLQQYNGGPLLNLVGWYNAATCSAGDAGGSITCGSTGRARGAVGRRSCATASTRPTSTSSAPDGDQ